MARRDLPVKLITGAVVAVVGLVVALTMFRWVTVEGSERVVWQTFSGVQDDVGEDGIHLYFGFTTTPHVYEISSETFIVDDKTVNPKNEFMDKEELVQNQPDVQPVEIPVQMDRLTAEDLAAGKTTGPTNVMLSCVMQYHLDSGKNDKGEAFLVKLHNEKTRAYRTTFLKDVLLELILSKTTVKDARSNYQGAGRVALQEEIGLALKSQNDSRSTEWPWRSS